jgi:integrase
MECIRLRVQDVDFQSRQITVRDAKGRKDRVTMLPEKFAGALQELSIQPSMSLTTNKPNPGNFEPQPA